MNKDRPGHLTINREARRDFPTRSFCFEHGLSGEPSFEVEEFTRVSTMLPSDMIEVVSDHTGILSISELIDDIKSSSTWMIFRNLEQLPTYKRIMEELLEDLTCELGIAASDCLRPMCFAFVSSPSVRVPLHIDPEHNFLFQVSGSKSVYLNRHEKDPIVSPTQIAAFYADEVGFSLSDATVDEGKFEKFYMTPSSGVYIPVTSPHYVINDEKVAVSFSVTFRSISSDEHRDRHLRMLQNHS